MYYLRDCPKNIVTKVGCFLYHPFLEILTYVSNKIPHVKKYLLVLLFNSYWVTVGFSDEIDEIQLSLCMLYLYVSIYSSNI